MKCPHCNGEHPDNYQFCPITGQRIEPQFKACTNKSCPDFGKFILPLDAKFCPCCGREIQNENHITFDLSGIKFNMIRVKAGTFVMGINFTTKDGCTYNYGNPPHGVTITHDYYIGQTTVTQELWMEVMDYNPSKFGIANGSYQNEWRNLPVEHVSWDDCQSFIKRISNITGEEFRLPTDAEWEYAARGGDKSNDYLFAGSDDYNMVAWADDEPHPVATKVPNELGIYDMSGNVEEWCQDYYYDFGKLELNHQKDPVYLEPKPIIRKEEELYFRVIRGGHCSPNKTFRLNNILLTTYRSGLLPQKPIDSIVGIRLALSCKD